MTGTTKYKAKDIMNTCDQARLIKLDNLTSLHVTGNDASKFLHAQFTNDLANLPVYCWQYSGYCTPKGRLLAFMTIARIAENDYFLIFPAEISEKILPRLRMFVMRDDVKITPQEDHKVIMGIVGSVAPLIRPDHLIENETGKIIKEGDSFLLTINDGGGENTERYMYISDDVKIKSLPQFSTDRNAWTLLDIETGIPSILASTQEAFVPQMVNLDLIGAVNFKKGCYPGQEIVARVHYLGKIKQRMFVVSSEQKALAQPNDKIFIAGQENNAIGTVVQSATCDSGKKIQAVLQTKAVIENADIRLGAINGNKLAVVPQPYSVLEDE